MSWQEPVAKGLTIGVVSLVAINVVPPVLRAWLNPTSENLSSVIVVGTVNWWIPLVQASPLLFVAMLFLFNFLDIEELLEV